MQNIQLLYLAAQNCFYSLEPMYQETFQNHNIKTAGDILALPDIPLDPDSDDIKPSIQSLCSNLVTDIDDFINTNPDKKLTWIATICYDVMDTVHQIHKDKYIDTTSGDCPQA